MAFSAHASGFRAAVVPPTRPKRGADATSCGISGRIRHLPTVSCRTPGLGYAGELVVVSS